MQLNYSSLASLRFYSAGRWNSSGFWHYFRGMMYGIIRTILFLFPPEGVHHFVMEWLRRLCTVSFIKSRLGKMFQPAYQGPSIDVAGLRFKNPVGLAAGFDKNALYLSELETLGFGSVEIGTVTPRAQDGNDTPRLFRLPEDKALINRMGFNNHGADAIADRLRQWREKNKSIAVNAKNSPSLPMVIGGNIGKNKSTPNELAYLDYDICFRKLAPYVDYLVINVSSPNTPGLRELQEKPALKKILEHLQGLRTETGHHLPLFLKIAPDLTPEQLKDVADLALEISLDGLVVSNTTLARHQLSDAGKIRAGTAGAGGLSGAPVRQLSTEVLMQLQQHLQGKIPIIASGGIFTQAHAKEKIKAGAVLVQVWTGFVYEGPGIVKNILKNW
jgi:dihydroorotate dehydrogenase